MKKTILTIVFLGGTFIACASTPSEPVDLPEMRVGDNWSQVTERVLPTYPIELRRSHETGRVSLDIVVDEKGKVKAVTVLNADNYALADAARDAVRRWKFVPDQRTQGRDVRHARVTFSFELEESA